MKATRVFQLTALVLVIVSVVQVGWWLFDQYDYTTEKVQVARRAACARGRRCAGIAGFRRILATAYASSCRK